MPATLNTQPNLARPDDFYEALIEMHRDLDDAQSQAANAQLILLLANHIGDHDVLLAALQAARGFSPTVLRKPQPGNLCCWRKSPFSS